MLILALATAATLEASPGDDIEAIISTLLPGDELLLHDGLYTKTDRFTIDIAGTATDPIIIRAFDGEHPHIHRPDAAQNLIDLDRAHYVQIRGIELSGGSAGLRLSDVQHFTLEDCDLHSTADVALRANDTGRVYEDLQILHNEIHDTSGTGEGMYLGCNSNGCQVANSLIANNWVHHTNGPNITQGDGIELKEGSYGNIIRDNVIHDTNYPCILTYSTVGNGPANVIEGNVMWACGDHGIQSAADSTIVNNLILSANNNGIALQPHQSGNPANIVVAHNTVLNANNDAISVRDPAGAVTIANNALYAPSGDALFVLNDAGLLTVSANAGQGAMSGTSAVLLPGNLGTDVVDGHLGGAPPIDLAPLSGGALVGAADPTHTVALDFNGLPRTTNDIGAYRFDTLGNPGWAVTAAFKEFVEPTAPDDTADTAANPTADTGGTNPTTNPTDPTTIPSYPNTTPDDASDSGKSGCGCRSSVAGGLWLFLPLLQFIRRRPSAASPTR